MNIFLPYPRNIAKSIYCLDDRRLVKQILECKQIFNVGVKINKENVSKVGYSNHPIVKHYKSYLNFVSVYAWVCCVEYNRRFDKWHTYTEFFSQEVERLPSKERLITYQEKNYTPLYVAGSKPHQIYETVPRLVGNLFIDKLKAKWKMDTESGHPPKWTNSNFKGEF